MDYVDAAYSYAQILNAASAVSYVLLATSTVCPRNGTILSEHSACGAPLVFIYIYNNQFSYIS